jgi:hypothetical protein
MIDDERALSVALRDVAEHGLSGSPPPIKQLLSRGRRRRHARAAFACVVGVTGAGVIAALVSVGPGAGTSSNTASGTPGAIPTGRIALSLAAERTDAGSFHYSLSTKTTVPDGQARPATMEGAFDPSTMRGYSKEVAGGETSESIRIGNACYAKPTLSAPWLTLPCSPPASGFSLQSLTEDPAAALKQLEAVGLATYAGRTGSGSGAVDLWKFTVIHKQQAEELAGYTVAGTARVGVAGGQVEAIDFTITIAPSRTIASSVQDASITFSDYGAPVSVSAPTTGSKGVDSQ